MDGATEKLELGLQRLAKAGDDVDLLGLALQSIHGALEDHFRNRLTEDPRLPTDQRAAIADPKKIQWKDLLDAMQLYADLSSADREQIWHMNGIRNKVAHGGRYSGNRAELEQYAALVQSLCGYTPAEKPKRANAERSTRAATDKTTRVPIDKPTRTTNDKLVRGTETSTTTEVLDIPRAIRSSHGGPVSEAPQPTRWPGGMLALLLLAGVALFAIVHSIAQPRADSAALPTDQAIANLVATTAPAPSEVIPPTPLPRQAIVNAPDGLNVRSDHSNNAAILTAIAHGTRITILDGPVEADGHIWWQVALDAQQGWCAGEFLTFDRTAE